MREKMERFSLLPFSIGCVSHSSVDVVVSNNPKKASSTESNTLPPIGEDGDEKTKSSNAIGERLHKIVKGFKSLPQVFQLYRDEEEDDDDDEVEMEIGVPTDVQHVAHIGWDGTNNISKSWNRTADQLLSFPSLSMRQIEIAMAKEGGAACL